MEQLIANLPNLLLMVGQYAPQVVGFALPLLVEVINRDVSDARLKWVVTVIVCALTAIALNLAKIQLGDFQAVLNSLGMIYVESQAAYHLYFKTSELRSSMQRTVVVTQ